MHVVSPSQITAADRCLRRWWFQSVKGFKAPSTPATEFGGKVHTALERRVITGAWMPDLQAVLDRAKPAWQAFVQHTSYLPSIMGGRDVVELAWTMDDRDYPLPSQGRIDLVCGLLNTIVDWKTTSSTRYMKSEAELAVDPQVILYTDALLREGKVRLPVDFLHVYTVTKGLPEAEVRRTRVTSDMLTIGREKINKTMQRMVDVLALPDPTPEEVPANVLACSDFGGCPHRERCFGGLEVEQEDNVNLAEKLAARKAAQAQDKSSVPPQSDRILAATGINPPESSDKIEHPTSSIATLSEEATILPEDPAPKKTRKKATQPEVVVGEVSVKQGDTLLIGAAPMFSFTNWCHFDEWVAPLVEQACENLKVPHWTVADFGKGKAAIVALVALEAKAGKLPSHLIIDRRSTLGDAACEVLTAHYRNVFVKMG